MCGCGSPDHYRRRRAMAITSLSDPRFPLPFSWLRAFFHREPVFSGAALVLLFLIVPTAIALCLDDRSLQGEPLWEKPLKFEIGLVLYLATLAWFAGWLPSGTTCRGAYRIFAALVVLGVAAEMVWLLYAAANGVASHFNKDQPVLRAIYPVMGLIAILLTSATLVYAWLIWRGERNRLDPAFRLSVVIGLSATFAATVLVAGAMAAGQGHFIGAAAEKQGMAILGWARNGGDLRVAHFFATHAVHALPIVGWLAGKTLPPTIAKIAVVAFATLYLAFIGWTFAEALKGRPFLPLLS
jgi:hypothetical protein